MGNSDIFLGGIKVMPDFTVRSLSSFFDYVETLLETRADHGQNLVLHVCRTSRIPTSGIRSPEGRERSTFRFSTRLRRYVPLFIYLKQWTFAFAGRS